MKRRNEILSQLALLTAFLLLLAGCTNSNEPEEREWQLVWEDEFDGTEGQLPDSANWGYDIGTDWGNQELQYNTDRPENVSLDGQGHLAIVTRAETFSGRPFTSARITTQGKFEQTYGRFEASLRLPYGPGIWPAFWLVGSSCNNRDSQNAFLEWPGCGEIDIMELRGQKPETISGTVHGPGYSAGQSITSSFSLEKDRFDKDFHIFAIEWGVDYIDFYVDDNLYQQITPKDVTGTWVFNQPFYIILNVSVGGNYVGFPLPSTPFPQTMLIDYVRVYQEAS